jgi:hypothetical protein
MSLIKSWSKSRLDDFEKCRYIIQLKVIDKIPEPERPLPEGKTEHANDRGTRIHDGIEQYVRGKGKLPPEAAKYFKSEIDSIKERFNSGEVSLEGEWGFDRDWKPCAYKGAWLRMKCDAVIHLSPTHIVVVDYKTGRKFGNEIKHGEQVQLYALGASILYPEAKTIDVELWYLDLKPSEDIRNNNITHETKPANKWLYHLKPFNNRGLKMTECTDFKPNPSVFACKWCAYKDGICKFAVTDAPPVRRKGQ